MSTPTASHTKDIGVGVVLAAVVALIVLAFSWPAATAEPRDVPVAVVGPTQQLEDATTGTFALTEVSDRAAAVEAVERREVYGAVVVDQTPQVLTSSAASPAVAQMLDGLAARLGQPGVTVEVTDVVPLMDSDPRGAALTTAVLPLVIGGILGGVGVCLAVRGLHCRISALVAYATVAGLAIAGILQGWLGVITGSYLVNAAAFGLTLLAVAATVAGLISLRGRAGIPVGVVLFLLVANPISSAAMPQEFLPGPWGEVGQWFPPGAGATLLRDLSYFPEASTVFPWLVLGGWTALGLLMFALAHLHAKSTTTAAPAQERAAEPTPVGV